MIDWADIAQTRQGLYRFLGEALLPPSAERFDLLLHAKLVLDDHDLDRFAFSRDWRRLGRHFPVDVTAERLDVEYVRLFASGMSSALSPPTESYYRARHKGGEIAEFVADLQREYRTLGVKSVGLDEPPDHIATELNVASHLCDLEASAWWDGELQLVSEILDKEARFLGGHPASWLPMFRERVRKADPPSFYGDLVDAVHAFVVHDHDYVRAVRSGVRE